MKFIEWCKKDINDERKINYTLNSNIKFTSDDEVDFTILSALRRAELLSATLIENEWFVNLSVDKINNFCYNDIIK